MSQVTKKTRPCQWTKRQKKETDRDRENLFLVSSLWPPNLKETGSSSYYQTKLHLEEIVAPIFLLVWQIGKEVAGSGVRMEEIQEAVIATKKELLEEERQMKQMRNEPQIAPKEGISLVINHE